MIEFDVRKEQGSDDEEEESEFLLLLRERYYFRFIPFCRRSTSPPPLLLHPGQLLRLLALLLRLFFLQFVQLRRHLLLPWFWLLSQEEPEPSILLLLLLPGDKNDKDLFHEDDDRNGERDLPFVSFESVIVIAVTELFLVAEFSVAGGGGGRGLCSQISYPYHHLSFHVASWHGFGIRLISNHHNLYRCHH